MVVRFLRLVGAAALAVTALAQIAHAEFIKVDPQGAFLRANLDDATNPEYGLHGPLVIDLLARGYNPGDVLRLRVIGTYALSMFPADDPYNSTDQFDFLGGVFSSTDELGAPGLLNRVTGAIDTGLPELLSMATLYPIPGGLPTDIPEDFQIHDTFVRIPALARFLFVAVPDIFYSDNRDPDGNFGLDIAIPEPTAATLMIGFAAGMALLRRQRAIRGK